MNNNELTLHIADSIKPYRKRSERLIGYVPYTLDFEMRLYNGTSQKPEKITILAKTIVMLINRGVTNITDIARCLGLDIVDEIERDLVRNCIDDLKNRFQMLQQKKELLSLTKIGREFIDSGKYIKTFSRPFELFVDVNNTNFIYLKECIERIQKVEIGPKVKNNENLSLAQIKILAEQQASYVQYAETGLELQAATLSDTKKAKVSLNICFLQSIRDNSVRTVVYEESSKSVIEPFSALFDNNDKLRDELLKKCLKNEVEDDEFVRVESGAKTQEQIELEHKIIEEANTKGEEIHNNSNSYDNNVGSVYDSAEFEQELHEIFETHQNDEIWLISPWIRKYAFLRSREPMIRKFLDQGGAIFIGYSEPERVGEEMVDPDSMSVVKRLDSNYDKFYYAELPKFHMKNVIEQKGDMTFLYTGSFNVLSFCIDGNDEHYRMEQMTFANSKEAKERRNGYLELFTKRYVMEYLSKIRNSDTDIVNLAKLDYLKSVDTLSRVISELEEIAKESNIKIEYAVRPDLNGMVKIAQKVLEHQYQEETYQVQDERHTLSLYWTL